MDRQPLASARRRGVVPVGRTIGFRRLPSRDALFPERSPEPRYHHNWMTLTQAYDEILDFLAAGTTAESIATFRPSDETVARVRELIERRSEEKISPVENEELEEYLRLEHLMIMAKARAQLRLRS